MLDAYRALIPFLTQWRSQLLNRENRDINQLRILDTVLLKTYLQASPSMISSLLRLKENFCIQSECEKILREAKKVNELVLLLQSGMWNVNLCYHNESFCSYLRELSKNFKKLVEKDHYLLHVYK